MADEKNLEKVKALPAYRLTEERYIREMDSQGLVLEHKKSGARIFLMANEDENKVFYIGFRTPPDDSTGLPHILEHSVLEGSEKFPVKDPFVELAKGSMNTFLNAMTYPDKTVYPVASCNDKDFQNLMDVYLDGVFHPSIYREPKIFRQEGWHYELADSQAPLIINGVVYNEMKGAFSQPESVLDRCTLKALFPDSPYRHESGGDPEEIPSLTYEQFIDFHKNYYHPANSYIFLYGNMDMAEKLDWLDQAYLSGYDRADCRAQSAIPLQKAFDRPVEQETTYSVTEEESTEGKTYLSVNMVVGTELDPLLHVGFQILDYALIQAPGAPLKQALIDAHIGQDILGGYANGILQPYFSVIAKNGDKEQKDEFLKVVKGTLRRLADEGMDKKTLLAGLNYYEFRYREADYGSAPKGLMYGLWSLDSWLYDGDPMLHLCYQETFDTLKEGVEKGYFEGLIRDYLLDNPHEAVVVVTPSQGQTAREDEALARTLAERRAALSPEETARLVEDTRALKAYQEEPSRPEDLEKIPMLSREDIPRKGRPLIFRRKEENGVTVIHTPMFTSGIGYLRIQFGAGRVPQEDLCYVSLLKSVLGYMDTEHYTYQDLNSEIYLNSGGIDLSVATYPLRDGSVKGYFTARAKVLYSKLGFAFSIIREMLLNSRLEDEKRLGEILDELCSQTRIKLEGSFHSVAVNRACSYFDAYSAFNEQIGGIQYYQFLENIIKRYREDPSYRGELQSKLRETAGRLFAADNFLVGYTANEEGYALLPGELEKFKAALPQSAGPDYPFALHKAERNEGFATASQVNYVARCGRFAPEKYTGALSVLKVMLNYDYLWINLRVKGGAYGCMSGFNRCGRGYLVSYRDPKLAETNRIYEGIPEYLRNFQADERDMTRYVIGAMSSLDAPLTPAARGAAELSAYLTGETDEEHQRQREEILGTNQADIRALADIVEEILGTGALCAVGNGGKIKENSHMFGEVKNLYT